MRIIEHFDCLPMAMYKKDLKQSYEEPSRILSIQYGSNRDSTYKRGKIYDIITLRDGKPCTRINGVHQDHIRFPNFADEEPIEVCVATSSGFAMRLVK